MSDYDRLLACGFSQKMAHDILTVYGADHEGLERYIRTVELIFDDRHEYV